MTSLFALAFSALISYLGYREAAKHQAEYGRSPWGVSPLLWALIVFFTGLIVGGILLWAARRSDRKKFSALPAVPAPAIPTADAPLPQTPLPSSALWPAAAPHPTPMPTPAPAPAAAPVVRRVPAGKGRPGSVL